MSMNLEPWMMQLSDALRDDVRTFRRTVERYVAGELDETRFRAARVPMGIYEQRNGGYMVRLRPGAGVLLPDQARAIAGAARPFGALHVTTRQGFQIHDVPIAAAPDLLETLLEAHLTARGGGGNTVRNIVLSPRAGVDPDEVFDVRPYAVSLTEYLLQFPGSFNLPRKFKIALTGGPEDDALASVTDAGFFARMRDGVPGWRVFGGGGMGGHPLPGILLEAWVEAGELFAVAEAVRRLFDRHGDRANRHAARLRFVLRNLGEEGFRQAYRAERATLAREGLPGSVPPVRPFPSPFREQARAEARVLNLDRLPAAVQREREPGFYSVRVNPLHGVLTPDVLLELAALAEENGEGLLRATQQQELLLCGVPGGRVDPLLVRLRRLGEAFYHETRPPVVACAGAATCKLGLCLSRGLARELAARFPSARGRTPLPPVRISGCPNSCGTHQVAGLGFAGKARRVQSRLMPFYDILAGGSAGDQGARLGERVGSLPARRIPDFLAAALEGGDFSTTALHAAAERFSTLPDPVPEAFFHDWGSAEPFSLAGRGPGQCGAGTMDIIRVDVETARSEFARAGQAEAARERDAALYEALLAAARALLPVFGLEPGTAREIFSEFTRRVIEPGWVEGGVRQILEAAIDWKAGDRADLEGIVAGAGGLIDRVEALFLSLDASLHFRLEPAAVPAEASAETPAEVTEKDLRGVACPMNFVKAKVALESLPVGAVLEILLDEGVPARNVPSSFREQGQEVVSADPEEGDGYRVRVRRMK